MASEIGDLYVVLRAITEPFQHSMKAAAAEGEASTSRIGGAFKTLSKVGIGLGAVGVAAIGATVKMAGDFQAEMAKIQTQAGVAKSKIADLSNGVLQLAGQVGFSPTSLAESLYHVESNFESMGISSNKALELVKVAAMGAASGGADLVDVTNALTAAVASNIPGVQDFSQAMGVLNATVGVGDMTMQDLASAFGSGMVATVKGFGLSIKDVGAALATFGDNNIRGSLAGNQLRMSVMALAKPIKGSEAALKTLGLTQDTLAKDMQQGGLLQALNDLQARMQEAGIGAKQQGQVITDAFGRKAGAGLNVLMDQMDRLRSKYPALDKAANSFGESWAGTQATFNQQLKETEQSLVAMGIRIGTVLLPYVQRFLGWIRTGVNWLAQHKGAVLALAGALGTALVAGIIAVGSALTAALGPEELIAAGILAVGAALVYAYKHFAGFRLIVNEVAKFLGTVLVGAFHLVEAAIKAVINWFHQHSKEFSAAWAAVVHTVQALVKWFDDNVLKWIRGLIADFVAWWKDHSQEISHVWSIVWAAIKTAFQVVWNGAIKPGLALLVAVWKVAWGIIKDSVMIVWGAIKGIVTTAMHFIMNTVGIILDLLSGHWSKAWHDMLHLCGQLTQDIAGTIVHAAEGFGSLLYNAGANIIKGLISGIKSMIGGVGNAMSSITSFIRNHLPFSPAKVGPLSGSGSPEIAGRKIGEMVADGLVQSTTHVTRAGSRLAGAARLAIGSGSGGLAGLAVAGAGGGVTVVNNYVTVQGSVIREKELFDIVQTQALRYNRRNPTSGLTVINR